MDRRRFLTTATAMSRSRCVRSNASAGAGSPQWAVFTPDHEVTFRTVMKPYAEAVAAR